jgi:hypothetical protein
LPGSRTDKYADNQEMRTPKGERRNIMLKRTALLGFLAAVMVGSLPVPVQAWWGGGCYRAPCYPRYYRPYYPRYYGGCGGCGGYRRYGGWGSGGCGGYGYGGYNGYGGGYNGYGYGGYDDGYGW